MLDQEREFFDEIRAELVDKHLMKFVLIKEKNLIGTYNTIGEALSEGARRFALGPFLVRQVLNSAPEPLYIPALSLGILNANSTRSV